MSKPIITVDIETYSEQDIKNVGEYVASVKLHKEVTVDIPVKVVAEGAKEEAPVATEAPAVEAPVVEATEEAAETAE